LGSTNALLLTPMSLNKTAPNAILQA